MSKSTSARARRLLASLAAAALVLTGSVAFRVAAAPAAAADAPSRSSARLQNELGCPGDWQPECAATELAPTDTAGVYAAEFERAAGSYEYKVAVDDAWDESYGLNGGGDNIPLTVAGPATLRFVFDDNTQARRRSRSSRCAAATPPTTTRSSRRPRASRAATSSSTS